MNAFSSRLSRFVFAVIGSWALAQDTLPLKHSLFSTSTILKTGGKQGSAVAADGAFLVLAEAGVVKIYSAANAGLLFRLNNPGNTGNGFGKAVAIAGSIVAVGAPTGDGTSAFVFIYDLGSTTPTLPAMTLSRTASDAGGEFGAAVSISGSRVVVGAPKGLTSLLDANSGVVHVFDLSSATPTTPVVVIPNPTPTAFDLFGAAVGISGSRVIVGAPQDDTTAADAGIAYVFDVATGTPATPVTTLNDPSLTATDQFGGAVAISGAKAVVGAMNDDAGALNAGRAFAYDLAGGTPSVPVVSFANPAATADDLFGSSVAIAGQRVVIGVPKDDAGALDSGRAYVYDLGSGTPSTPVLTLDNQTPDIGDLFGSAVAATATHVLVGAPNDDDAATDAGAGHLFDPASGTPTISIATLKETTPTDGDEFGTSVAADGSLLAVGAPFDDEGAPSAGRVYVFDLASGTPTIPSVVLNNPSPTNNFGDGFGERVAASGSFVVVAAAKDDSEAGDSGRVYVFDVGSGTPGTPIATLINPSPGASDLFGFSVAVSGDLVVVGAPGDDTAAASAGIAYVYDMASGTPTVPIHTINNLAPTASDTFGDGVGISGTRVIVGAAGDRIGGKRIGSVYVYDIASANPTTPARTLNNPVQTSDYIFGQSIAIAGDRLVLGSPPFLPNSPKGRVYLYDLGRNSAKPTLTLNAPTQDGVPTFGANVALAHPLLLVSARSRTTGIAGASHIYDLSGSTAVPIFTLRHPSGAADTSFGESVAFAGALAIVGNSDDDFTAPDKGAAYAFEIAVPGAEVNVATQTTVPDLTVPPGTVFDSFSAPDAAVFGGRLKTMTGQKFDAVFDATGDVLLRGGEMREVEAGGATAMVMKVMPPTGDAVLASFQRGAGVGSEDDQTLFTGLMTSTPQPAVRRGQDVPNHPGVKLKSFLTLDGNGTTTFFSGTLKGTGVTPGNNQALFAVLPPGGIPSLPESGPPATGLRVLVRKGDVVFGKTVRTIATLVGQAGSLAEGRWRSGPNAIGVRLTFTDKTQALYIMPADADDPTDWLRLGQTDDDAGPDLSPDARLLGFTLPAYAPQATIFESLLRIGPGGVTKKDNGAVFDAVGVETGGPITRRLLAQRARPAPSLPTSGLARFRATLAGIARGSTFVAQTTLPGSGSRDSIFDARGDGQFRQVARIGDPAPGGGRFTRFTSVARPDTNGYGAFVSALLGGVSARNRAALFAVDSGGDLRRMLRTGDRLESTGPGSPLKQIKSFVALSAAPGSIGASRGYDAAGRITVLVTFTDRSQAVVSLQVP